MSKQQKRIAELEAFCKKTLDALNIFIEAVVANDMIVPRWAGDLKDELEELLKAQS